MMKNSAKKRATRQVAMLLAMILALGPIPLRSMATDYICGKTEHTHTDECYEDIVKVEYICPPGDNYIHTHDELCYDEDGNLVCPLEEAQAHTHTEACYTQMPDTEKLICGQEEVEPHTHTDDCYTPDGERILACPADHEHTDGCYIWSAEGFRWKVKVARDNARNDIPIEFEFPDNFYADSNFFVNVTYTDPSFESKVEKIEYKIRNNDFKTVGTTLFWDDVMPDGGIPLNPDTSVDFNYSLVIYVKYTDDDGTIQRVYDSVDTGFWTKALQMKLSCGLEETEGHTHTEDCYETIPGELELTCGLPERHIHDDTCYDEAGELICEKPEAVEHQHTDECRVVTVEKNLICEVEEHTHTDACIDKVIIIDGKEYPSSSFATMKDFLTSAILTVDGTTYDLMDKDQSLDGINAYKEFRVDLNWEFEAQAGQLIGKLYTWSFPGIVLPEAKEGPLEDEQGKVLGNYYIDTNGTVYIAMTEEGREQSFVKCAVSFGARWASSSDGKITIDLGNGCVTEIELDMARAVAEKTVDGTRSVPGVWNYTVDIDALDDVTIESIDDVVLLRGLYKHVSNWAALNDKDLVEAFWMQNSEILLPDGTVLPIEERQVVIDAVNINGEECIRYHINLAEPIHLAAGESLKWTYDLKADPELVIYMDLMDISNFRLDNTVDVYLDDDSVVSSNNAWFRHGERDMIDKEAIIEDGASVASWEITVDKGRVYSTSGMLIQDTIKPEFSYIPDSFACRFGSYKAPVNSHICETQEEFDALTAETAEDMVYIYGNSFKYFIPSGVQPEDRFHLTYQSTYDAEIAGSYGPGARLNQAELWYKNMKDSASDGIVSESIIKKNDGIHVDEEGYLYTNWSAEISIPKDTAYEAFFFEDYVPVNGELYDELHLSRELDGDTRIKCNTLQEVNDLGITLSMVTSSGVDIIEDIFGRFEIRGIKVADEDQSRYFTMCFYDKDSVSNTDGVAGGLAAMDEDCVFTVTVPMYLRGDGTTFREHRNKIVWYFTDGYNSHSGRSDLNLPYINNDELLNKKVVASELSEDGTKTILTYQARYNMFDKVNAEDFEPGIGYTFSDKLTDTTYAKYLPGSLKVYWTKTIDDNELWAYNNVDSPYNGETNLLAIDEDVRHKLSETEDKYERLATLLSESESGFKVSIPYYMPTHNFRWHLEEDEIQRFYSPLFEYQVEVDTAAMEHDKQWRWHVLNELRVYLTDGTLDAVTKNDHSIDLGAMKKGVIQRPTKENDYTVKYQLVIDATSSEIRELDRLDVIDVMSSGAAKLLTDEMVIEHSEDKVTWKLNQDHQIMYDRDTREITCLLDNDPSHNYYRITYALQLSGMAGDKVSISNSAYVVGYKEQQAGTEDDFVISSSGGNAEGKQARIELYKYNRDNLTMGLEGALFRLSGCNMSPDALSGLGSQDEVLAAIGSEGWTVLAETYTNADGKIDWQHNTDGLVVPLNTLLKIEEVKAPSGYLPLKEPIYFYLSPSNDPRTDYLMFFEREPIQTSIPVANSRGAFIIEKQDEESHALLSGAEFWLYPEGASREDGIKVVERDDGTYYFGDLELGMTYHLEETVAPEGYVLDDTVYTVTVAETGAITVSPNLAMHGDHYVITNRLDSTPVLPETGGQGECSTLTMGLALTSAAIVLMSFKKKRGWS